MTGAHERREVLHAYEETREAAGPILTRDGQAIPVYMVTAKMRCECGAIYLDEILFREEDSADS